MRRPVSICIMVYNEADRVRPCIESVLWGDEIVVTDSNSTDGTQEILAEYPSVKVHQVFTPTIAEKRIRTVELATHDWVFCVDADEVVPDELRDELCAILERDKLEEDGFFVPRKTFYVGKWIRHCGWYPDYTMRLFRKSQAEILDFFPHDRIVVEGKTGKTRHALLHYTYRNMEDHIKIINRYSTCFGEGNYECGRRASAWTVLWRSAVKFLSMYIVRGGILDGSHGLILSMMGAFYNCAKYAKLWEQGQIEKQKREKREAEQREPSP